MDSGPASEHDIRCICARQPILAKYGYDRVSHAVFVHVKRWKQDRLLCEIVVTGGRVQLHCPTCLRWLTINIKGEKARVNEEALPAGITDPGKPPS